MAGNPHIHVGAYKGTTPYRTRWDLRQIGALAQEWNHRQLLLITLTCADDCHQIYLVRYVHSARLHHAQGRPVTYLRWFESPLWVGNGHYEYALSSTVGFRALVAAYLTTGTMRCAYGVPAHMT